MRKRPYHLAVSTVSTCVSKAEVGDNRILLSGGTKFIVISCILVSPSFQLGGATVVMSSID